MAVYFGTDRAYYRSQIVAKLPMAEAVRENQSFFNQLIKEHQGRLTPVDLSLKANLTGGAARRFLDQKAEEYGAQRKQMEDKGTIYYFLTASALGSILDDSEPLPLLQEETQPSTSSQESRTTETPRVETPKPAVSEVVQPVPVKDQPSELPVEETSTPVKDQPSESPVEETPTPVKDQASELPVEETP